jgi:RNA polymerase sigma-70 factor, ECF subfamily
MASGSELRHDEIQLEEVVEYYGRLLMNFAYTYLKDWTLSEDAVQEVFIKWYKKANTIRDTGALKTWLYQATANQCKDMLRKSRSRFKLFSRIIDRPIEQSEEASEEAFLKRETQNFIEKEVLALPVIYREVVILYYYEDYSTTEIATLLSSNISTVKTRLTRARDLLKGRLEGGVIHE